MPTNKEMHAHYCEADRIMLLSLGALLLACLGIAVWNGSWLPALLIGLPALIVPTVMARAAPGVLPVRMSIAAAMMVFAALMIHQSQGVIEVHFGIFVLLAFLLYYRDWRTVATAAVVIALHHVIFYFMQVEQFGVYLLPTTGNFGIIILHAVYVVIEAGVLIYLSIKLHGEAIESARVSSIAAAIGQGDLTGRLSAADYAGKPLLKQVVEMQQNLACTIAGVRNEADQTADIKIGRASCRGRV